MMISQQKATKSTTMRQPKYHNGCGIEESRSVALFNLFPAWKGAKISRTVHHSFAADRVGWRLICSPAR